VIYALKVIRIFVFVGIVVFLVGCSEKSTTIGDLYLESYTALQAYKHGKYNYIPADNKITVTAKKEENQFKITAIGFVHNRKMALHLIFPQECLSKNDTCLLGANKEFDALRMCVDNATSGKPATSSCSVSSLIINDGMGSIVRDKLNAPNMDVWIYDVD
jgi:hypothetical protein